MKIYTRGGDRGDTSLLGGERVAKSDPRIEAYGTVDELNAVIGVVRAAWPAGPIDEELARIQSDLFDIGAHLAASGKDARFPGVTPERATVLEAAIDGMEGDLDPLRNFILPGGSRPAAHLHVARCVCRRAERLVVALPSDLSPAENVVVYLNRLSDYLFVAARFANRKEGVADVAWRPS